jgi:L-iditol 2-dehydrogenase
LVYKDVETPKPKKGEVLVRIRASGICGSDIQRVWQKGTYRFPTIPGHEFSGEVTEVGEDAAESWIGKKAAVFPLLPCGECVYCETGNYAQCENYDYYGSRRDGGFAEYLAVKERNLVPLPDGLDYASAALCEPCAVAVHALGKTEIPLGGTVVIYGTGTIGLMAGKIAQIKGTGRVVLVDVDGAKLDFAKRLGFTDTATPSEIDVKADVCLEGTGVSAGLEGCLKAAKTFGTVVCLGNPAGEITLTQNGYWEILRKELTLKGTWNSGYSHMKNDWVCALDILLKQDFSRLITHRYTLSQCNEAFEMLRDKSDFCVKAMFVNE